MALIALTFVLGWSDAMFHQPPSLARVTGIDGVRCSGVVIGKNDSPAGERFVIRVDSVDMAHCRYFDIVAYTSAGSSIDLTDRVTFTSRLDQIADTVTIPDEINYGLMLKRQGISARCFIQPDSINLVGPEPGLFMSARRLSLEVKSLILGSPLNDSTKEFLTAALLGDGSLISDDDRASIQSVGLAHILALSGLHVAIISMVITIGLFPLYLARRRRELMVLTALLLWVYAVMTGLNSSVTRAVIMATVLIASRLLERRPNSVNSLSLAALIILFFNPGALFTIGFQLSFSAVASILVFANALNPVDHREHPLLYNLFSLFTVSLAAMLGTGVPATFYFHQFPLFFLLTNLVATLLLPPLLVAGIVVIVGEAVGCNVALFVAVADGCDALLSMTVDTVGKWPLVSLTKIYFPAWMLVLYGLFLLALGLLLHCRRPVYLIAASAVLVAMITVGAIGSGSDGGEDLIVIADARRTSVIARCGRERAMLYTNAFLPEREEVCSSLEHRLVDYLHRRGLDSLTMDSTLSSSSRSLIVTAAGTRVGLIGEIPSETTVHLEYAVITRNCRPRSFSYLLSRLDCDTVVLSADISKRRHDRYADSLRRSMTPFVSMRERPVIYCSKAP